MCFVCSIPHIWYGWGMALITISASSIYYVRISKTFHRKLQTEKVTEDLLLSAKFVFTSHYNYQVGNYHLAKTELEKALAPPLQRSCLGNPVDGGAWWAAVHGVAQSRDDWATALSLFTFMLWGRAWQPAPVFLPGESRGSRVGCGLWDRTELDTTEAPSAAAAAKWNYKNGTGICFCLDISFLILHIKFFSGKS